MFSDTNEESASKIMSVFNVGLLFPILPTGSSEDPSSTSLVRWVAQWVFLPHCENEKRVGTDGVRVSAPDSSLNKKARCARSG